MGYNHMRIHEFGDRVHPETDATTFRFGSNAGWAAGDRIARAHTPPGVVWMDGLDPSGPVPVARRTYDFARGLLKANPAVKFLPRAVVRIGDNDKAFGSLAVYYETSDWMLGWIGHGTHGVNKSAAPAYTVFSRKIKNGKVAEWRDQYNMVMSEDINRAVKNACKYIVQYTDADIADMSFSEFQDNVQKPAQDMTLEAAKFISACSRGDALRMELPNLITQGVNFVTSEFRQAAAEFLAAEKAAQEERARRIGGTFLRMYPYQNKQYVSVLRITQNVRENMTTVKDAEAAVHMPTDELPLEMQTRIAVLLTVKGGTYIPNIGQRVSDDEFWVEQDL